MLRSIGISAALREMIRTSASRAYARYLQLVENVRVPARDVGDHEVCAVYALPDVNENVGRGKHIVSAHRLDGHGFASTGQGAVDIVRPLEAKGHDDETADTLPSPLGSLGGG